MKRFAIVLALVCAIIAACFYSHYRIGKTNNEIHAYTGAVFAAIGDNNEQAVHDSVQNLVDFWEADEKSIIMLVRHAHIDTITASVAKLGSYTRPDRWPDLHAELSLIARQIKCVYESEHPTLVNIL